MDTEIDVIGATYGVPAAIEISLRLLFEQQEQRFSRFRPDSLLSRLNAGEAVTGPLFARGCTLALDAWRLTNGLFNPLVLPALRDAGYQRSFETVASGAPRPQTIPHPEDVLHILGDRVALRAGALDLGGIVKGWTVDLAIESFDSECEALFINAGGDLRATGSAGNGPGWEISIAGPADGAPLWSGQLDGAAATSSTTKRRWRTAAGKVAHHLIDPRTGLPADSPFEQVTVLAPETWLAEVWAKAILIGGDEGMEMAAERDIAALAVERSASVRRSDRWPADGSLAQFTA